MRTISQLTMGKKATQYMKDKRYIGYAMIEKEKKVKK
jgi:hypothetical protein